MRIPMPNIGPRDCGCREAKVLEQSAETEAKIWSKESSHVALLI